MKKKSILIICSIVILVAVIAGGIFLYITRNDKFDNGDVAPTSIDGTWAVVGAYNSSQDKWSVVSDSFVEIKEGVFNYYFSGVSAFNANCEFKTFSQKTFTTANAPTSYYDCELNFTNQSSNALPAKLGVKYLSQYVLEFIDEQNGKEWKLVFVNGSKDNYVNPEESYVKQLWHVNFKGHEKPEMTLNIKDNEVDVSSVDINATLPFTVVNSSCINITGIGNTSLFKPKDGILVLAVFDGSYVTVWELTI